MNLLERIGNDWVMLLAAAAIVLAFGLSHGWILPLCPLRLKVKPSQMEIV